MSLLTSIQKALLKKNVSDKTLGSAQITLIINEEIISDDESIAKKFEVYFSGVAKNLTRILLKILYMESLPSIK